MVGAFMISAVRRPIPGPPVTQHNNRTGRGGPLAPYPYPTRAQSTSTADRNRWIFFLLLVAI
jgi:hypothetical protein